MSPEWIARGKGTMVSQNITDRWEFLIKVNQDYFLAAIEHGQVTGTAVMSAAAHFDYRGADKICAGLRVHGYPNAYVTTITGQPVTEEILRSELTSPADSLPQSAADIDRIPAREFKRRMLSDPQFRARVDKIDSQAHTSNR